MAIPAGMRGEGGRGFVPGGRGGFLHRCRLAATGRQTFYPAARERFQCKAFWNRTLNPRPLPSGPQGNAGTSSSVLLRGYKGRLLLRVALLLASSARLPGF